METYKTVSDSVHGPIPLTELETQVIRCSAFQRLRRIKQLGLVSLVFPSADYSRFAHSLGVCHLAGRVLDGLDAAKHKTTSRQRQLYRLAALLHDVGHYPLAHCAERAITKYYKDKRSDSLFAGTSDEHAITGLRHEEVGQLLLKNDEELRAVLCRANIDVDEITGLFIGVSTMPLPNLISSDLDVDRVDYLLRTAQATGLPYGSIDLDYIMGQLRVDKYGRLCISQKGMRAVEHFLVSRFFKYQQVIFHKTSVGLELAVEHLFPSILDSLDFSEDGIRKKVIDRTWGALDDSFVLYIIRDLSMSSGDREIRSLCRSVIDRKPPALIADIQFFAPPNDPVFKTYIRTIREACDGFLKEQGIAPSLVLPWQRESNFTSVGGTIPVDSEAGSFDEVMERSVRIVNHDGVEATMLVRKRASVLAALSGQTLYAYRLFVVCDDEVRELVKDKAQSLRKVLDDLPWV